MLLAQPFDPFKEQQQQKKVSFLARFRVISRTRRALLDLKNRVYENKTHRQFLQKTALMMPDHHFMLNTTPPTAMPPSHHQALPPWCDCYGCFYDPYISPNAGLMFPPLPPPGAFHPAAMQSLQHHHQMPYSICVHISSSPPHHQQQQQQYQMHQRNESSSFAESTLYSSGSSMYSGNEKELIEAEEEDQQEEQEEEHLEYNQPYQRHRSMPAMQMHRSNSDMVMPQQQRRRRHTIHHRPSFNRRWASDYYN